MQPEADDSWTVVGRNGRNKKQARPAAAGATATPLGVESEAVSCATPEESSASLLRLTRDLQASAFSQSLRRAFEAVATDSSTEATDCSSSEAAPPQSAERYWGRFACIRCYGLGSPTTSLNARAQLALVPVLQQLLPGVAVVSFYDPVLSDADEGLLRAQGYSVLTEAEAQRHAIAAPTLFYMPHCDAHVYNEVLDSNWSSERLADVAILGNSFEAMQDRWSGPTFKRRAGRPHRVLALTDLGLAREEPLQCAGFRVQTAFNDTALHVFSKEVLDKVPDAFSA